MPPSVLPAVDIALVRAWVEASCAEQGIRSKVEDVSVIRQVVTLLTCEAWRDDKSGNPVGAYRKFYPDLDAASRQGITDIRSPKVASK